MELYSTDFEGIGGRLKARFEDFVVEEITPDHRVLTVRPWSSAEPIDGDLNSIDGTKDRFVHFVVQKMGLSTIDVANILAAQLKLSREMVSYAGLKDKRAITTQAMSVPSNVSEALCRLRLPRINIREVHYAHAPVSVGDLWGNRFDIVLRNITCSTEEALQTARQLSTLPLLNYFDIQRFGVTRPSTCHIGRALVKQQFEDAVRIMLTSSSEYEPLSLQETRRQIAETMTLDESVLNRFPQDLKYERLVIRHLIRHPGDYLGAITKIPPRILTIFVNAFQSYLFNRIISHRARSGIPIDRPVPGDFIVSCNATHSGRDSWLYVTEENFEDRLRLAQSGQYAVAAPVPGYSTKTPPSIQTDILKQILADEDVMLSDFRSSRLRALDSPGGLHFISFRLTDLEVNTEDATSIRLRFSLPKGSYATTVLRELMKNHPINRT